MTFLGTQPKEERQQQQMLEQTPGDPDAFKPGFFAGSGSAIATGVGRVVGVANQFAGELEYQAGALFTRPIDELFGSDATGFLDEKLRQDPARLTAAMTPDPYTTGSLGQILYSLVGIGLPTAAGAVAAGPIGAAYAGGAFATAGTYTDLTQQGVDANTAAGAALFEGVMTGAGVGLPAAIGGKVALSTLLYGPGINVAQDVITAQGTAEWLESQGYGEIAERYATIDAEMIAADIVLGAAFGYWGARGARPKLARPEPETADVDAALAAVAQRNVEIDTAPGIPADLLAVRSHTRNLQNATESLLAGRAVEAAPMQGKFAPRPVADAYGDAALVQAFRESGYPELLAEVQALEADLATRGRALPDEALPEAPEAAPAPEAVAPRAAAARPAQSRAPAATVAETITPEPGRLEVTARTKAGEFRLVDEPAAAGADFSEFGQIREVVAYDGDTVVGRLLYANDGTPPTIEVEPGFQRRGIATAMLKLAKQQGGMLGDARTGVGGKGRPTYRTDDGQAFRENAREDAVEIVRAPAVRAVPEVPRMVAMDEFAQLSRVDTPLIDRMTVEMRGEIGWSEVGGRILRGGDPETDIATGASYGRSTGEVVGRSKWVPKPRVDGQGESEFWRDRPGKITEKAAREALDKFEAGKALTPTEKRFVDYARQTAIRYMQEQEAAGREFDDEMLAEAVNDRIARREELAAMEPAERVTAIAETIAQEAPRMTLPAGIVSDVLGVDYSALPVEQNPNFRRWFGDSKVVDAEGKPLVVYHGTNQSFDRFDRDRLGSNTKAFSATEFFFTDSAEEGSGYADLAAARMIPDSANHERRVADLLRRIAAAERRQDMGEAERLTLEVEELEYGAIQADPAEAQVYPVYLSIQNPLRERVGGLISTGAVGDLIARARAAGHDGLILDEIADGPVMGGDPTTHYVAFRPEQIKSATANRGTFDPSNPSITDALAAADAEIERATIDSTGYGAAVDCFLRSGA